MLKNFNITAILVCLISMCSINHAAADGHVVEFCYTENKGVTLDQCLTAINKGVKLYQTCWREDGCEKEEYASSQWGEGVGLRTLADNGVYFIYDGKSFFIKSEAIGTHCYAWKIRPCTD